jgi:myo-inositol-1(or 4)-monophosphatase
MGVTIGAVLDQAHRAALRATALARKAIADRDLADFELRPKGAAGDVVSSADIESERLIVAEIHHAFPEHRIVSEEGGGVDAASEWTWLVDPLDGTNNVALGLPLYGSCVTLCHRGEAVVAAIYVAHEDVTYSAIRGGGAFRDGTPIRICHQVLPQHATVSWINGYAVTPDDDLAVRAQALLARRFKRLLNLWSPSVDWSLLVSGHTGALVAYKNEPEDLLCGVLIAAEAGARLTDLDGHQVSDVRAADGIVVAAPNVAPYLAEVLAELGSAC